MKQPTADMNFSIDHLRDISAWVSHAHDLTHLLELILETGARIMRAKASSLLLLNPKTGKLQFRVATGRNREEIKKFEVKMGEGIVGNVVQTGKPLLIPDAPKDPRWSSHISDQLGFKTRSIVCVPLKINDRVIGAMEFINKEDDGAFNSSDMELLAVFADLAAVAITNARKFRQVEQENAGLKQELDLDHPIIGKSGVIRKVMSEALKVADSQAAVLITGESGTGKELLARMIHLASPRRDRLMIALNCAAIPETLLEGELFGHEKGAFTGADAKKTGKFELADESTIFLDEIAEMIPSMQAKLLRVLQDGVFYRVGGNTPLYVDIRIISATNKDLVKEVETGKFRQDLYYRLNVVKVHIPPLRERKEDIPLLAEYFVDQFKRKKIAHGITVSQAAMERLMDYPWPGNVRELQNAIERAVVMGNGETILPEDLPILQPGLRTLDAFSGLTYAEAVDAFKKDFILMNLKNAGGKRIKAASAMGLQRSYLSRLITHFGIENKSWK